MYTLMLFCCFAGFFALYNTSKRAKLSSSGKYEQWLQANPRPARYIGGLLIAISIALFVLKDGWGIGLFTASLLLMTAAAYTIAIAPFYCLNRKYILIIVGAGLVLETLIF